MHSERLHPPKDPPVYERQGLLHRHDIPLVGVDVTGAIQGLPEIPVPLHHAQQRL